MSYFSVGWKKQKMSEIPQGDRESTKEVES